MAKLTDRSLDALRPRTGRYEIWDDARKGFGVRVTPRGVKSSSGFITSRVSRGA